MRYVPLHVKNTLYIYIYIYKIGKSIKREPIIAISDVLKYFQASILS